MSFLQKSLVITQFAASIILLIVVAFMQKQVNHILAYDLGFDKEHVLYVHDRQKFDADYRSLEGEFSLEPSISNVTKKTSLPMARNMDWLIKRVPDDNKMSIIMELCYVSANYFDFFGMKIIDGVNPFFFEGCLETDVVINETAARLLGYAQPVGEMMDAEGERFERMTIRAVVSDAYTQSLHHNIEPQIYFKYGTHDVTWNPVTFFKISGDPQRAITFVENKWKERAAEYPFIYNFLDDTYKQLYTAEMNAGKVFAFAMLVALVITVAGLFAMAYYATQRRMKEVAIRKVYGATLKDIFIMLNKSFLLWVAIAFAIACPLAYWGLQKWLDNFIVKTPLDLWVFIAVGVIALLITLFTTCYQTWKVATANPVKFLKTE